MLILTRRAGQSLVIGQVPNQVTLIVLEQRDDGIVRLGFQDRDGNIAKVPVIREELLSSSAPRAESIARSAEAAVPAPLEQDDYIVADFENRVD